MACAMGALSIISCHRFEARPLAPGVLTHWSNGRSGIRQGGEKFFALTPDLGQAALQEPLFRLLPREGKRRLIAGFSLVEATEAAQQVGPGGVREVIAAKAAQVDQGLDEGKARLWAVTHRH